MTNFRLDNQSLSLPNEVTKNRYFQTSEMLILFVAIRNELQLFNLDHSKSAIADVYSMCIWVGFIEFISKNCVKFIKDAFKFNQIS
jgi:hypothetical protein